ncbi:MAG: hypothetical protein HYT39_04010 [Candidatus Sungbacteria bacterium]|nr:hypothetical protein [Candidatus Sungbacteria bacterium]
MSKLQVSLVLILLGGGIIYFLFMPQLDVLKEAQADHAAATKAIDELQVLTAKRDELTDIYNNVDPTLLNKVASIIPADAGTSMFLAELEALANKDQMVLKSVDFSQPTALEPQKGGAKGASTQLNLKQGLSTLPLGLQISGRYDNFRRFLSDLELNQRLIDVGIITFGSRQGGPGVDVFDFAIQAKAYYQ